jgi:hypothetical protein
MIQDTKLNFIWAMARLNFDNYILIEDLFQWCGLKAVQTYIAKYKR